MPSMRSTGAAPTAPAAASILRWTRSTAARMRPSSAGAKTLSRTK